MTTADQQERGAGPAPSRPSPSKRFGCAFEIVETLVLTLLIYLIIHIFVAQPFEVRQDSMLPTIVEDDYVLIDKLTPHFDGYTYGDVVVFDAPDSFASGPNGIPFIKRVIGLPGDTIFLENGRVFVTRPSGVPIRIEESYLARNLEGGVVPTLCPVPTCSNEWVVPEGSYFVMGDNRSRSEDSRAFGPVDGDLILGRAWLRYFPLERVGLINETGVTRAYEALDE